MAPEFFIFSGYLFCSVNPVESLRHAIRVRGFIFIYGLVRAFIAGVCFVTQTHIVADFVSFAATFHSEKSRCASIGKAPRICDDLIPYPVINGGDEHRVVRVIRGNILGAVAKIVRGASYRACCPNKGCWACC